MTDAATDLVLRSDQTFFDQRQVAALRQLGVAPDTSNADLAIFFHHSKRTGLDPFAKQIYLMQRRSKNQQTQQWETKSTIQTGIDGYRLIARKAAQKLSTDYDYGPVEWCDSEGNWSDVWLHPGEAPIAARVTLYVGEKNKQYPAIAHYSEYVQTTKDGAPNSMWQKMAASQLAKCFDTETEVLTERGFMKFSAIRGERIMQVTPDGLEAVNAVPFVQSYDGPMVTVEGERLNFAVTPNHDMVTTLGKVEARAIAATVNFRGVWEIPLTVADGTADDESVSDADLELLGYVVADGSPQFQRWNVSVSRPYKVAALANLAPVATGTVHSKGSVSSGIRPVRTNFDKVQFSFAADRVSRFLSSEDKAINIQELMKLSQRQVRVFVDAWQLFDGHTNKKTNVRRVYMNRPSHVAAFEALAVKAGYSVNVPKKRESDISSKPGYSITISTKSAAKVLPILPNKPGLAVAEHNESGQVWCVTVPSGQIVVRRNGFSMVCGNCAEALALRKAFPLDLSGIYTEDEMQQADMEDLGERMSGDDKPETTVKVGRQTRTRKAPTPSAKPEPSAPEPESHAPAATEEAETTSLEDAAPAADADGVVQDDNPAAPDPEDPAQPPADYNAEAPLEDLGEKDDPAMDPTPRPEPAPAQKFKACTPGQFRKIAELAGEAYPDPADRKAAMVEWFSDERNEDITEMPDPSTISRDEAEKLAAVLSQVIAGILPVPAGE